MRNILLRTFVVTALCAALSVFVAFAQDGTLSDPPVHQNDDVTITADPNGEDIIISPKADDSTEPDPSQHRDRLRSNERYEPSPPVHQRDDDDYELPPLPIIRVPKTAPEAVKKTLVDYVHRDNLNREASKVDYRKVKPGEAVAAVREARAKYAELSRELKDQVNVALKGYNTRLDGLTGRVGKIEGRLNGLDASVGKCTTDINGLQVKYDGLRNDFDNYRKSHDEPVRTEPAPQKGSTPATNDQQSPQEGGQPTFPGMAVGLGIAGGVVVLAYVVMRRARLKAPKFS